MDTLTTTTLKALPAPVVAGVPEMPWPQASGRDTQEAEAKEARGVRNAYRLGSVIHEGKASKLHQATYVKDGEDHEAVIKVGRAHDGGQALVREAQVLRSLISSKGDMR